MDPIIIIGSGLAGYSVAREFRTLNLTHPLLILTDSAGDFYSKPLLSTALSKQQTPEALVIKNADTMMQQLNATILTHTRVTHIDPKHREVFVGQKSFRYQDLILACGAELITPPLAGHPEAIKAVRSVNQLEDYKTFRQALSGKKRIAILGAGLVGCEFANDLLAAGFEVHMIAPCAYPFDPLLPEPIGKAMEQGLRAAGAQWHLGRTVTHLDKVDDNYQLTLSDQSQLQADLVLSAIGLRPNTTLAQTAGLAVGRGIIVNHTLQTTVNHIYALGDCAEVEGLVLQYVAPLLHCARALAKTLTGQITAVEYPPMPIAIKTPYAPITFLLPAATCKGQWHITGEDNNLKGLFYDATHQLRGFALTGAAVKEKMELVQHVVL